MTENNDHVSRGGWLARSAPWLTMRLMLALAVLLAVGLLLIYLLTSGDSSTSQGVAASADTTAAPTDTSAEPPAPTVQPLATAIAPTPEATATAVPPAAEPTETTSPDETASADGTEDAPIDDRLEDVDRISEPFAIPDREFRSIGVTVDSGAEDDFAVLFDPPDGQTGSDTRDWLVQPTADMIEWGANYLRLREGLREQLFDSASFPCGVSTAEYVVTCPTGAASFDDDEVLLAFTRLAAPIEPGDGTLQFGLAIDDGDPSNNYLGVAPFELDLFNDTEIWYRLQIDAEGKRLMWADGMRIGTPGFPRHSSALAIEWGDVLMWLIPRSELPVGDINYRLTSFFNSAGPEELPAPETAGGDVSGLDVSTLTRVPDTVLEASLGPDVPLAVDTAVSRLPGPVDDPDVTLATALTDQLQGRLNAAFATGETEPVRQLMHFFARVSSPDACQSMVERSFPAAQSIVFTDLGPPVPTEFFVSYSANAVITYPTGDTSFPVLLVPDLDGRLGLFIDCN